MKTLTKDDVFKDKYQTGIVVWCRPSLANEPKQGIYIRSVTKEENVQKGYRSGEMVEIDGNLHWVRSDLCDINKDKVANIKW